MSALMQFWLPLHLLQLPFVVSAMFNTGVWAARRKRARARAPALDPDRPRADSAAATGDEALRRYRLARARKAELETRKVERDLIPAREVAELLQRWCVGFRERLLAIPGRLSDRLPAEHQDALRKELIGTLQGLYELRDEWAKVSA